MIDICVNTENKLEAIHNAINEFKKDNGNQYFTIMNL